MFVYIYIHDALYVYMYMTCNFTVYLNIHAYLLMYIIKKSLSLFLYIYIYILRTQHESWRGWKQTSLPKCLCLCLLSPPNKNENLKINQHNARRQPPRPGTHKSDQQYMSTNRRSCNLYIAEHCAQYVRGVSPHSKTGKERQLIIDI